MTNLVSFIFLSKYIMCCISILLEKDAGKPILMLGYSILYLILSIIAFAAWWGNASHVKYDGD